MAIKIMLVEDDTNLSDIYKARLEAEGFMIVSAVDGEAALALAVKEKPDLIISDVMMPKISGFDMLDILRSTDGIKGTKVIMMTALSQAEDKDRANKLGADRYLVKSQVTLEDVVKVVHEVLDDGSEETEPKEDRETVPVTTTPLAVVSEAPPEPVTKPAAPAVVEPPTPSVPPEPTIPPATPTPVEPPEPVIPPPEPVIPPSPPPVTATPATPTVTSIPVTEVPTVVEPTLTENKSVPVEVDKVKDSPTASAPLAPVTAAPTEPTTPTPQAVTGGQSVSDEQSAVLDQIKDFVDKQEQTSADKPKEPDTTVIKTVPVPTPEVAPKTAETSSPAISSVASSSESADRGSDDNLDIVTIANKKVIQPPDKVDTGPSLSELLAKEDSSTSTPSSNLESYAAVPSASNSGAKETLDPNSIAL